MFGGDNLEKIRASLNRIFRLNFKGSDQTVHKLCWQKIYWQITVVLVLLFVLYFIYGMFFYQPNIILTELGTPLNFNDKTQLDYQIKTLTNQRINKGLRLEIDGNSVIIPAQYQGQKVFSINSDLSTEKLWSGTHPKWWWQSKQINSENILLVEISSENLTLAVSDLIKPFITTYQAPGIKVVNDNQLTIIPEIPGKNVSLDNLVSRAEKVLSQAQPETLILKSEIQKTKIPTAEVEKFIQGQIIPLDIFPLTVTVGNEIDELSLPRWLSYLQITRQADGTLQFSLNAKGEAWLSVIGQNLNSEANSGSITFTDNKVSDFTPAKRGSKIDVTASGLGLIQDWLEGKNKLNTNITDIVWPEKSPNSAAAYGLYDLIGQGKSNFGKSPKNRIHNINLGVKSVNGTLIPPGEEFSLLEVLGKIDSTTGYLPELVIKGNKTIPEYGGGLCQIGTTAFRGAINSGLPITARQNHSYTVSYYAPIGTDATIYNPAPDFKFKNDTAEHVLIQARIVKTEVIFDFWGLRDGRIAEYPTIPKTFNRVPPPPMKIIETTDLKPGEKKCTENARDGIDAVFDYNVTYADGTKKTQTFRSRYKPWQAVCLVGVAQNKNEILNKNSSVETVKTPANISAPSPDLPSPEIIGIPITNTLIPAGTNQKNN